MTAILRKIPVTVVTGFLGAGKTSLIRHLAERAGGRRLAFIINEFGAVGIDRELLLGCGVADCQPGDVIELANGCICCTVADDFLPTMALLLARSPAPDHIIIETSGLALPKPLVQAFQWPEVKSRTTVDAVVAVVDGAAVAAGRFAADLEAVAAARAADPALDHERELAELYADQLACADLVVLNKTDLLSVEAADRVGADIALRARSGTALIAASHGRVDPALLLGLGAAAEDDLAARPSHHDGADEADHGHDAFASTCLALPAIDDVDAFIRRLERVIHSHGILRAKGFLDVPGRPLRLVVQAAGPRLERHFDRPWGPGEPRASRLVLIGPAGLNPARLRADLVD